MSAVHVTRNAVDRYLEHIDPTLTADQVIASIEQSARAIRAAALFGCRTVKRDDGTRLILDGETVVTVVGRGKRWGSGR